MNKKTVMLIVGTAAVVFYFSNVIAKLPGVKLVKRPGTVSPVAPAAS